MMTLDVETALFAESARQSTYARSHRPFVVAGRHSQRRCWSSPGTPSGRGALSAARRGRRRVLLTWENRVVETTFEPDQGALFSRMSSCGWAVTSGSRSAAC